MKRLLGLLLVLGIVGCGSNAALERLGAEIARNEQGDVIEVNLSDSQITDAGLVHLKALINLDELYLSNTQVTDVGLVHLKELTNLQKLYLWDTQVTDAGLLHLKGLTNLEYLYLHNTPVTDAGVRELKKALPKCDIRR